MMHHDGSLVSQPLNCSELPARLEEHSEKALVWSLSRVPIFWKPAFRPFGAAILEHHGVCYYVGLGHIGTNFFLTPSEVSSLD